MKQSLLLKQLTMLDFMATDLHLFLNTHPDCKEAISEYNKIIKEADMIRRQYEKMCGPLCSYRSLSREDFFTWVDDPWPWEKEYNFYLAGEER